MSYVSAILKGMNRIPWSTAAVVIAVLAAVTVLVALGRDPAVFMSVGTLVLGAIMYGEVRSVRDQTNGNTSKMLSIVDKAATGGVQSGQTTVDSQSSQPLAGVQLPESEAR